MIMPTEGGIYYGDPRCTPICEWLAANRFDHHWVPIDALIEIRDGTCLGVEMFTRGPDGQPVLNQTGDDLERHIEWHPMVQAPPDILLPQETP